MKGPAPASVSTSPAALTAATRVVCDFDLAAFSTMLRDGYMAAPPTIGVLAAAKAAGAAARARAAANGVNLRMGDLIGNGGRSSPLGLRWWSSDTDVMM